MKETQTVPNLVHSLALVPCQLPVLIDRVFLEKVPNLVSRGQEIVVANVITVSRAELRLIGICSGEDLIRRVRPEDSETYERVVIETERIQEFLGSRQERIGFLVR